MSQILRQNRVGNAGCNFLLLSLAAKGKKNIGRSLCNFLLLSLAAKEKFEIGQGRAGQ
jgi:hypothetical protein